MSTSEPVDSFPSVSLLPKKEINALSFISKYPQHDGRGVVIAIFDTGVDPGAAGLQVTSDGKPKIIDIFSATGENDVDTSKVVSIDDKTNTIVGLSGRKLKIPSSWSNPTGEWHVGLKLLYELYPRQTLARIKKEYQTNEYLPELRTFKASCLRDLQEFEAKEKEKTKKSEQQSSATEKPADSSTVSGPEGGESLESQFKKENLQTKVDIINSLEENYTDLGPAYDCVVFNDGQMWRACIDVTATGDLDKCDLLGPYKETLKYAILSARDQINYSVNIYDNGNLLEINCVSSDHGTHVASIAAANFPEDPDKNGIAPGAQIIAINIGHNRLGGGMESGASIIRGCIKAIESKADVINMSFGEPAAYRDGRVQNFMAEVTKKHGITFVTASGNDGPNISTVTANALGAALFNVAAYVSPEMMEAEYSTREKIPGRILTFSSKDPALDGAVSNVICAPGAAITSITRTTLAKSALFNGTSMASPNACGGVALVMSGLKQKNVTYSPFSIRRAFENTAAKPPNYEPLAMGNGLMQVDAAFEHVVKHADSIERDVWFDVKCVTDGARGIYFREQTDLVRPSIVPISIKPVWLNHENYDNGAKADFEMKLSLTCDAPWVQIPNFLLLTNYARNISVKVDPTGLPEGINFTWIRAYDTNRIEKGFIFQIPITVLKPTPRVKTSLPQTTLTLKPGIAQYRHIIPPVGTTVAVVKVKNNGTEPTGLLEVGRRQMAPQTWGMSDDKDLRIAPGSEAIVHFPIWPERSATFSICKHWANFGDSSVDFQIDFCGAHLDTSEVTMFASKGSHKVSIFGSVPIDAVQPKASLTHSVSPLKPVDEIISPLSARDVLPEGRQIYGLMLTYEFSLSKATDVTCIYPLLDKLLYENEFHSHYWQIFNSNKQVMLAGEAVPKRKFTDLDHYSTKLDKGDYTIKLQLRHENPATLKKLNKSPIHLITKLPAAVNLEIFASYNDLLTEAKQFGVRQITEGQQMNAYIKPITADKMPKNIPGNAGSFLVGAFCLAKDVPRKKSEEYALFYILDGESTKKPSDVKDSVEKPIEEKYLEAFVDFKIQWVAKLQGNYESLLSDIGDLKPDKQQMLIVSQLQSLNSVKDESAKQYKKMIDLADQIISAQKVDDFYGSLLFNKTKSKIFPDEAKKDETLKNLEKAKERFCEALFHKGISILAILKSKETSESKEAPSEYSVQQVDEIISSLMKLEEVNNSKYHSLVYQHALVKGQYGRALHCVRKQLESKQTKELYEQLIECYERLGWTFAARHQRRCMNALFPPTYRLF